MDTTSRVTAHAQPTPSTTSTSEGVPPARRTADGYLRAPFPWYGLDDAFTGPRWLMQVGTAADGTVQHGSTGHGDEPSIGPETAAGTDRSRFAVVVTVAANPVRRTGDNTGVLDATTVSSAAWLAGSGLLAYTWPAQLDHALRNEWLDQQTETAFELADDLEGPAWTTLSLPVDGVPHPFHYRESEFGWVLAGSTSWEPGDSRSGGAGACTGVHLGAYGRGMSAYGLGFSVVADISTYA